MTRRAFLEHGAAAAAALLAARVPRGRSWPEAAARYAPRESALLSSLRAGDPASLAALAEAAAPGVRPAALPGATLAERFADLRRHFVFEYYPWYGADPWRHWTQWDRQPPDDIAASSVPKLGAYDSAARATLERHARWIADSGAGAINLSWWGVDSPEDRLTPLLMDVMRDHDLKVAFHLEPYAQDHGSRWQEDVLYLLRQYGDRRGFDCLLLLQDEDGRSGPVFKGFRTILPKEARDCHGVVSPISDYTADDVYARQFDALRKILRGGFDHLTLLADSLDFQRAARAGFDGIAIYDNFVAPSQYALGARRASDASLLFSFNANPGYDSIEPRIVEPDSCYAPAPFAPEADRIEWARAEERERAAALALARIAESLQASLAAQTDPAFSNARNGFFLAYLNSFNEWHEGHAFEPMKDAAELTPGERRFGYHNPVRGDYRLRFLSELLRPYLAATAGAWRGSAA